MLSRRILLLLPLTTLLASPAGAVPDGLSEAGEGVVVAVLPGGDLRLADGRVVRPAALLLPRDADGATDAYAAAAEAALSELVRDRPVRLQADTLAADRYGRVVAHLVRVEDGLWLQEGMLRRGLARVETRPDLRAGAAAMLAAEGKARAAGVGLWSDRRFQVRRADRSARDWAADAGAFHIVRGRVRLTQKARDRLYLNFGADWSTDFTAEIERRDLKLFEGVLNPLILRGRIVEVRGWVQERGGPMIRVTHPEQIVPIGE